MANLRGSVGLRTARECGASGLQSLGRDSLHRRSFDIGAVPPDLRTTEPTHSHSAFLRAAVRVRNFRGLAPWRLRNASVKWDGSR
jgi:hypothetical protein